MWNFPLKKFILTNFVKRWDVYPWISFLDRTGIIDVKMRRKWLLSSTETGWEKHPYRPIAIRLNIHISLFLKYIMYVHNRQKTSPEGKKKLIKSFRLNTLVCYLVFGLKFKSLVLYRCSLSRFWDFNQELSESLLKLWFVIIRYFDFATMLCLLCLLEFQ